MRLKSKLPLCILLASLFVASTLALRFLTDQKTEGDGVVDALMNQHHDLEQMHEECRRRCQRQDHRGQAQQWQCQEKYGYERGSGRGGCYGEWDDDEVEVVLEFDNQGYGPQQHYRECQRRCQRQAGRGQGGQWQCHRRCEEEYQRQSRRVGGSRRSDM